MKGVVVRRVCGDWFARLFLLLPAILFATNYALAQQTASAPLPPVRIILVGDSTMAVHSGWGPGFCGDVVREVACINMARGGRSSSSYRAEGLWAKVMEALKSSGEFKATYVLIQFGHNDQPGKPGRSTDLATEFPANLRQYVEDVSAAGGNPVLITPLSRRQFKGGQLTDGLGPWAEATKRVAQSAHVPLLDLHGDSLAAIQKMGSDNANSLAMATLPSGTDAATGGATSLPSATPSSAPANFAAPRFDYTHLGDKGAAYFGRMIADELVQVVPELRPYVTP